MKESDMNKMKRYFSEGVSAEIWCYSGDGNWSVSIHREGRARFIELDDLCRRIIHLKVQCERGDKEIELWSGSYADNSKVRFCSTEDVVSCVVQINKAVQYIQSVSKEDCWRFIPYDTLSAFTFK